MNYFPDPATCTVAILGLGYVGLPLALEFAKERNIKNSNQLSSRKVIGFDINKKRVDELLSGIDSTKEIRDLSSLSQKRLLFTSDSSELCQADVFIVTVPTPIDESKRPDTTFLESASSMVGLSLKERFSTNKIISPSIVIFESTVYPGATEELCAPIIEKYSTLSLNRDFYLGYSPERINPGDPNLSLTDIVKVTSGSTPDSALWIDSFYASIIDAGTHICSSIKVAEAAKVIENTQRDINIALMNELAIIFDKMNINIFSVLKAASTKWNFLSFYPGLVGGHCIGVDPYYLTYKSEILGYKPEVVLSGRRINDSMPSWIVERVIMALAHRQVSIGGSRILILGLTFKENCLDVRNSKVFDIQKKLCSFTAVVDIFDPLVLDSPVMLNQFMLYNFPNNPDYDAIILAVSHDYFIELPLDRFLCALKSNGFIFDIKNILPADKAVVTL